jgi:hypothetical protein
MYLIVFVKKDGNTFECVKEGKYESVLAFCERFIDNPKFEDYIIEKRER